MMRLYILIHILKNIFGGATFDRHIRDDVRV